MKENYLTLNQSIRGAIVFLNVFGLVLEELEYLDEFSKLRIYDSNGNEVGKLYFDNGKVKINVNYNLGCLNACYDIPKVRGLIDYEYGNALFAEWNNKIEYTLQRDSITKFSGTFLISCSMDSEFGINCKCHPYMECMINGKKVITLKLLRDGKIFGLKIINEDECEEIEISPFDRNFFHCVTKGEYDGERNGFPYRKYIVVRETGYQENNGLMYFASITEYDNTLSVEREYGDKNSNASYSELLIQKGNLMQKNDSEMFKKIEEVREWFNIDGVSLLDNFINVSLTSYNEDEIRAMFGVDIAKVEFQNNTSSLVNAYYGIEKDNKFLSVEAQKRLLKNKN